MYEPNVFEKSVSGRVGYQLPKLDVPNRDIADLLPIGSIRDGIDLPELSEPEVVRHLVRLGQRDFSVDGNMYPLGSCTMKYNPRIAEAVTALSGFANLHPHQDLKQAQGALQIMYELKQDLAEICGLPYVTLQPSAGSSGELTGIMVAHAYFSDKGELAQRRKILLPDSAHGTNPASAALYGYEVVNIKSDFEGNVDLDDLKAKCNGSTAMFMLTNPSTLGLFDPNLKEIADIIHGAGALFYGDGANFNALVGKVKFGGILDIMHYNLHKTFGTPHGGGGPGSGPIAVTEALRRYLPDQEILKQGDTYFLGVNIPASIGGVSTFNGAFGVMTRAHAYIRSMGPDGLRQVAEDAVLSANYLRVMLKRQGWKILHDKPCMHEVVVDASDLFGDHQFDKGLLTELGIGHLHETTVIANALMDYDFHPPTVDFPRGNVLMIEPTETESLPTLDEFLNVMGEIRGIARGENPEELLRHPISTSVGRVNAALADRVVRPTYDIATSPATLEKLAKFRK